MKRNTVAMKGKYVSVPSWAISRISERIVPTITSIRFCQRLIVLSEERSLVITREPTTSSPMMSQV